MTTEGGHEQGSTAIESQVLRTTHMQMLQDLAKDEGQDPELTPRYMHENENSLGVTADDYKKEELAEAIVQEYMRIASGNSTPEVTLTTT
jgi:hypothetical protein